MKYEIKTARSDRPAGRAVARYTYTISHDGKVIKQGSGRGQTGAWEAAWKAVKRLEEKDS